MERHSWQLGHLQSILCSRGEFAVRIQSPRAFSYAQQVSRNLCQYFAAASTLFLNNDDEIPSHFGNVITICLGGEHSLPARENFPITVDEDLGIIADRRGKSRCYYPSKGGLGLICLRPMREGKLELFLWGSDEIGLRLACRLIPTLTGAGQPDFVIIRKEVAWKGASGALGMGFFDSEWEISAGSYMT